MGFEVKGTGAAPVPVYPQAGAGPGAAVAQLRVVTRVFVRSRAAGWARVRTLSGERPGTEGWVAAGALAAAASGTVADDTELEQLFEVMRTAQFTAPSGQQVPIPYRYPAEGCFARAAVMTRLLAGAGYTADKVFAVCGAGLRMQTAHGSDQADYGAPLQVTWRYHVAPVVYADMGEPVPFVIDPSTGDGPQAPADWAARFAVQPVDPAEIGYGALRLLLAQAGAYPADRTLLVRAGAAVYAPPAAANPATLVQEVPQSSEAVLELTAAAVPAHDAVAGLDAFFRTCLSAMQASAQQRDAAQPYPAYAADLLRARASIQALAKPLRTYILTTFPTFLGDAMMTFTGSGIENDIRNLRALLSA